MKKSRHQYLAEDLQSLRRESQILKKKVRKQLSKNKVEQVGNRSHNPYAVNDSASRRNRSLSSDDIEERNWGVHRSRMRREANKLHKRGTWDNSKDWKKHSKATNDDARNDTVSDEAGYAAVDATAYTYQQHLTWAQVERIVMKGLVIHVNPSYYRSTAKPPLITAKEKFIHCCAYTDAVINGPAKITEYMYLGGSTGNR